MERAEVADKILMEEYKLNAVVHKYKAGLIGLKDLDSAVASSFVAMRDVIEEAAIGS